MTESPIFLLGMSQDGQRIMPEGLLNVNAGLIMLTCFFFAHLSGKLKAVNSIMFGTFLTAVAFTMIGFTAGAWIVLFGILIFSVGEMFSSPKFLEYIGNFAPEDKKAMYLGFSQLPLAIGLIDACPQVQFVLDHCGVPDIGGNAWQPWADHMTEVAARENVVAKVSGVMAYGDGRNWTLEQLRPYVEHTINTFGWDRVVWGSDSPVCTLGGEIASWIAALRTIIDTASTSEKSQLFEQNARRIWKL